MGKNLCRIDTLSSRCYIRGVSQKSAVQRIHNTLPLCPLPITSARPPGARAEPCIATSPHSAKTFASFRLRIRGSRGMGKIDGGGVGMAMCGVHSIIGSNTGDVEALAMHFHQIKDSINYFIFKSISFLPFFWHVHHVIFLTGHLAFTMYKFILIPHRRYFL